MTDEQLQAIKERLKATDAGRWVTDNDKWPGNDNLQYWVLSSEVAYDGLCACVTKSDAEFIAHARHDVPVLVAEVEHLQHVREGMTKEIERRTRHASELYEENERLRTGLKHTRGMFEIEKEENAELQKENEQLRVALEFYADRKHYGVYTDASNNCPTTDVLMDDGYRAREALKK